MYLPRRPPLAVRAPTLNMGVVLAVLLASLAAGFVGGVIVWLVWRYDILNLARREP